MMIGRCFKRESAKIRRAALSSSGGPQSDKTGGRRVQLTRLATVSSSAAGLYHVQPCLYPVSAVFMEVSSLWIGRRYLLHVPRSPGCLTIAFTTMPM